MYKKTVKYTNLDGEEKEKMMYFNYTAEQLIEVLQRQGIEFEDLSKFDQVVAEMQKEESPMHMVRFMHDLVVSAYGERDESGEHFFKSDKIRWNFDHSAAFEQYFTDLMADPKEASRLMRGATVSITALRNNE